MVCAAVAPRQTMPSGLTTRISACSHGLQASICRAEGFLCSRRLPRGSQRKCFDGVGDVHFVAGESGIVQCVIEQPAGRPNKRMALLVFFVARNLAEQN